MQIFKDFVTLDAPAVSVDSFSGREYCISVYIKISVECNNIFDLNWPHLAFIQ